MGDAVPRYVQQWLPGFEPKTVQPDLPGLQAGLDEIEPSVSDLESATAIDR